jgi:hypothetical protein
MDIAPTRVGKSSTVRTILSVAALLAGAVSSGSTCFAQDSTRVRHSEFDVALDPRQGGAWFSGDAMRLVARASVVWESTRVGAGYRPAGAVAASLIAATMARMQAARRGLGHYTELRLTGTSVLLPGDSLTLRAGSDLQVLLQGVGVADWAGDAAALIGWRSRAEVRWVRPTTVGEFSLTCRVDRKADEFSHGQAQARWLVRF